MLWLSQRAISGQVTETYGGELPGILGFQTTIASDGVLLCSYHGQG